MTTGPGGARGGDVDAIVDGVALPAHLVPAAIDRAQGAGRRPQ